MEYSTFKTLLKTSSLQVHSYEVKADVEKKEKSYVLNVKFGGVVENDPLVGKLAALQEVYWVELALVLTFENGGSTINREMRRRPQVAGVDLFPFLDILSQTVGCVCIVLLLILIKLITSTPMMAATLVWGRGLAKKTPAYLDFYPGQVILYQALFRDVPMKTTFTAEDALRPDGPLARYLNRMDRQKQYIILLVREGGEGLYRQIKFNLQRDQIDFGGGFPWRMEDVIDYELELRRMGITAPEFPRSE